ncbi:MAG TPA: carbohydrate kinase family protein [Candidatus Sulfomarinibacteraceae bacterium]|nr:carbohydrate kinase family protein [Candidatus Sulfomarinibacteraceae bacterium]
MTIAPARVATSPRVVVAGLLCLDIIPSIRAGGPASTAPPAPGELEVIGPAALALGGCVGNTGVALHRLGLQTTLVARIADDPFGRILGRLVRAAVPGGRARLIRTPGGATSYSVIDSRPEVDRAIRHFPGVNDRFVADDVPSEVLGRALLLHVGYPPLMADLVADDGRELARLMAAAHRHGAITSLDMASAESGPGAGVADRRSRWQALLRRVLPDVDVFLPSLDEAAHLLDRAVRRDGGGAPAMEDLAGLAGELLELGAGIAGLKLGGHGLYVRSAPTARIAAVPGGLAAAWVDRELHSTVFESHVVGTTGAGDATIAGFLFGLVNGMSPEATMTAACAVGGASTEAADGTTGIPDWRTIERRIAGGWRRREDPPGAGWRPAGDPGLWLGPLDRAGHDDPAGSPRR